MIEIVLASFIALIAFTGAGLVVAGLIRSFRPRQMTIRDYPELPPPEERGAATEHRAERRAG